MPAAGSLDPRAADIGARLDRLRWSRAHLGILLALGAGWLFDSLEVNLVGSVIAPMQSHFHASTAAASRVFYVWLIGIMVGALAGGRLADRFGRRRLFTLTLLWYAGFTVLTALSPSLRVLYGLRFLTGIGVGGEYAIVNAAIAEFMPARVRGRANAAVMNFWPLGAIASGLVAYLMLDTLALPDTVSWRYGFALGGVVALVVLVFRRRLPESPRWLVSRGRVEEAEAIVARLEREAGIDPGASGTDQVLVATPRLGQALRELVRDYPGRLALGCALDLAEAFGYYGLFALLSIVVLREVHVPATAGPFFYILGSLGALAGGLVMTSMFDRLGRRRTVALFYGLAAAGVGVLAAATSTRSALLVTLAFMLANGFATGAWTSAYPTFTELFPTHLRGAGIGASVAVGRLGAAYGTLYLPTLGARLGPTASYLLIIAFWLMGLVAIAVYSWRGGVEAARRPLESLVPARALVQPG